MLPTAFISRRNRDSACGSWAWRRNLTTTSRWSLSCRALNTRNSSLSPSSSTRRYSPSCWKTVASPLPSLITGPLAAFSGAFPLRNRCFLHVVLGFFRSELIETNFSEDGHCHHDVRQRRPAVKYLESRFHATDHTPQTGGKASRKWHSAEK